MPRIKDADTTGTASAAVAGNVTDQQVLLDDLGRTQELVMKQEEMIQKLAAQVEKLSQTAESDPPVVAKPKPPQKLPDGTRRYASRFTQLTLVKKPGKNIMIDGNVAFEPGVSVDFNGGVYQTDDADIQAWLSSHPALNQSFWEDEHAIRRFTEVQVQPGVKTTTETPRVAQPLVAPMT